MSAIPGYDGNNNSDTFLAAVESLLASPAGKLTITSEEMFADLPNAHLNALLKAYMGDKPSIVEHLGTIFGAMAPNSEPSRASNAELGTLAMGPLVFGPSGATLSLVAAQITHGVKKFRHNRKQSRIANAAPTFTISRGVVGLTEKERALFRAMATLAANLKIDLDVWRKFFCQMTWAEGRAELTASATHAANRYIDDARKFLILVADNCYPKHDHFLAQAAALVGRTANDGSPLGALLTGLLSPGARWLTAEDLANSRVYSSTRVPASLQVGGFGPAEHPVYFNGNESLVTIAGPGVGKSMAQVVPNLLTFPGSAFVLDVKDELWAMTANHRQKFGDVYRFAPTDTNSHRYNPFDLISKDPVAASNECEVMANQLIPDRDTRDPYWDRKAREYVWALSMLVAMRSTPVWRNLASVLHLLSVPTSFPKPDAYFGTETEQLVKGLDELAYRIALPQLASSAGSIHSGLGGDGQRLTSVFDNARSYISPITRSPTATAAMRGSDWHPLDLRRYPGTTVYLCLKPAELRAYAPLVRLIFQQHISQLTSNFQRRPGEPPITFFLDELPQLGNLPTLSDIIDVGRGAGVRLWMFMQYLGQMRSAYKDKANGLIDACQVRCYMQPDKEAAEFIAPALGKTRNIFTGEERPLAEPHDLMGREFRDDIITLARGEHPARFRKKMAHDDPSLKVLIKAPPHVKQLTPPRPPRPIQRLQPQPPAKKPAT